MSEANEGLARGRRQPPEVALNPTFDRWTRSTRPRGLDLERGKQYDRNMDTREQELPRLRQTNEVREESERAKSYLRKYREGANKDEHDIHVDKGSDEKPRQEIKATLQHQYTFLSLYHHHDT